MSVPLTPSQTVGPFFGPGLDWADGPEVVPADAPGALWLRGRVLDGRGEVVPDALVETWQADANGRYPHPDDPRGGAVATFRGFGRCPTDAEGRYALRTCKPGAVPAPGGGTQAPHVAVSVFARGLSDRLVTRVYFPDEAEANDRDPVLTLVLPEARETLVARRTGDGYAFDIRLQGPHETAFLSI